MDVYMNLNVTLEFACYTQYVEYMYLCIYGKTLGPTITAFCGRAMFQPKIEQPKLYFTTKAKPSSPNKHQLKYTLTINFRNHY